MSTTVRLASFGPQIVGWIVGFRCVGVLIAVARQALRRKRTVVSASGWAEIIAAPEPFLMMTAAYVFLTRNPASDSTARAALAGAGAVLAVVGIGIWVWGFATIPSLSSGHYVLREQALITTGAFGFVRHPIYLGVFVLWIALAAASASLTVLAMAALYVIPAYVAYMRSEERMMCGYFGAAYRAYQARTGMILPNVRVGRARRVPR